MTAKYHNASGYLASCEGVFAYQPALLRSSKLGLWPPVGLFHAQRAQLVNLDLRNALNVHKVEPCRPGFLHTAYSLSEHFLHCIALLAPSSPPVLSAQA